MHGGMAKPKIRKGIGIVSGLQQAMECVGLSPNRPNNNDNVVRQLFEKVIKISLFCSCQQQNIFPTFCDMLSHWPLADHHRTALVNRLAYIFLTFFPPTILCSPVWSRSTRIWYVFIILFVCRLVSPCGYILGPNGQWWHQLQAYFFFLQFWLGSWASRAQCVSRGGNFFFKCQKRLF